MGFAGALLIRLMKIAISGHLLFLAGAVRTGAGVDDFTPRHVKIDWCADWRQAHGYGQVINTVAHPANEMRVF